MIFLKYTLKSRYTFLKNDLLLKKSNIYYKNINVIKILLKCSFIYFLIICIFILFYFVFIYSFIFWCHIDPSEYRLYCQISGIIKGSCFCSGSDEGRLGFLWSSAAQPAAEAPCMMSSWRDNNPGLLMSHRQTALCFCSLLLAGSTLWSWTVTSSLHKSLPNVQTSDSR